METKYFTKKDVTTSGFSVAFLRKEMNYELAYDLMEKGDISQNVSKTDNLIIFHASRGLSHRPRKRLSSVASNRNIIIFSTMPYASYNVTATAKAVIIEKNVKEDFLYEDFLFVHNGRLVKERLHNLDGGFNRSAFKHTVSLRLHNIDVPISEMEIERKKETIQRLKDFNEQN